MAQGLMMVVEIFDYKGGDGGQGDGSSGHLKMYLLNAVAELVALGGAPWNKNQTIETWM